MSWQAVKWARATRGHRSPGQKTVLFILAEYANKDTNQSWPSIKTLVEDAEMSKRAVINATNNLEQMGLITRLQHGNQHQQSVYQLNLPGRACDALPGPKEEVHRTTEEVHRATSGSASNDTTYKVGTIKNHKEPSLDNSRNGVSSNGRGQNDHEGTSPHQRRRRDYAAAARRHATRAVTQ